MSECKIVENQWDKDKYDFEYKSSNEKYKSFSISNWTSSGCPIHYRVINDTDVYLYFRQRLIPKLFEKKYIPLLKEYLKVHHKWKEDLREIKMSDENGKTVGDVLRELGIEYLSINWGHTRTILNAYDRIAVSYAKSFSSALIVFKKRGGYLAYYVTRPDLTYTGGKATEIDTLKAINIIKDIHNNPKDNILFSENTEDIIKETEMINRL